MNRRELLKLLALGVVGHTLDIDKLLWIPGQKKIFIPSGLSYAQIVAIELENITHNLKGLFERNDTFYSTIRNRKPEVISSREMRVPLIIEPGKWTTPR